MKINAVSTYALTLAMLLATVLADEDDEQSIFRGESPMGNMNGKNFAENSWGPSSMSANNNPWTSGATAGAIIGFTVFGLSYLYVVIYIFYDINRSKKQY